MTDNYSLNWPNYTDHIKRTFNNLLRDSNFADVTLSCEGKKLKAHRLMLSTFSTYFHELLMDNLCSHPIIILRDVEYQNMLSILEFMYLGEVQVSQEKFGSFLKTAEMLKVSGLGANGDEDMQKKEITKVQTKPIVSTPYMRPGPASKKAERLRPVENKKRLAEPGRGLSPLLSKKFKEKSTSPVVQPESEVMDQEITKRSETGTPINIQKLLQEEIYLTKEANPENECPICAQQFATMYMLKVHIPYHKGETKCHLCQNVFSRVDVLKKHLVAVHKITAGSTRKD